MKEIDLNKYEMSISNWATWAQAGIPVPNQEGSRNRMTLIMNGFCIVIFL